MITEAILTMLLGLGGTIFDLIGCPQITLSSSAKEAISYACSIIKDVLYFFPLDTIGAIAEIVFAFIAFKFAITAICKIWDLLPIL